MEVKQHKTKKPKWPAWFKDFYDNDYKPFQIQVLAELKRISQTLDNIIKYNNLKTHE